MLSVVTPFQVDLSRYYSPGEGSQVVLTLSTGGQRKTTANNQSIKIATKIYLTNLLKINLLMH